MTNHETRGARATARKLLFLLLFCVALIGASQEAQACRAYGGLIDGFVDPVPPSQVQIDQ